ncbi:MAG TPA: hypothetical protein VI248_19765 [Kineosporiaceae bacterium]
MRIRLRPEAVVRATTLVVAGALPVLSIPLHIAGVLPIGASARDLVLPFTVAALVIALHGSLEGRWAAHGFLYGLAAVTAYDTMRLPLVFSGIWPDFIPRLGGWIDGRGGSNIVAGYAWRYLGDGGGIGLAFFTACGLIGVWQYPWLSRRPIQLGIAYGVFIWSGLLATVALTSRGAKMLFPLTPTSIGLSLAGHLIYGGVLGVGLHRRILAADPLPPGPAAAEAGVPAGTAPRGAAVLAGRRAARPGDVPRPGGTVRPDDAAVPQGRWMRTGAVTLRAGGWTRPGGTVAAFQWRGMPRGVSLAAVGAVAVVGAATALHRARSRDDVVSRPAVTRLIGEHLVSQAQRRLGRPPLDHGVGAGRNGAGPPALDALLSVIAAALESANGGYASAPSEVRHDPPGRFGTAATVAN